MKIIDKNKDYYDFLMGVYGQDPKAVYDRRGSAILHKDRTPEPLRKLAADSPFYIDGLLNILAGRMMHVFTFTNRPGGITYEETNCYEVNRESSVPLRIRLEWKSYPFPKEHINTCRWRMTAFPIRHPSGEVTHEDE